jgi:medium-chain acyl-[acyl-carrier-protein] hydrolase
MSLYGEPSSEAPAVSHNSNALVDHDRAAQWIRGLRRQCDGIRLLCFPHAGGGASVFGGWRASFPAGIELCPVQYPGRENRWGEPGPTDFSSLITVLADDLVPLWHEPFAFLGHSFGAAVAFELARVLVRRGFAPPLRLFLSAARAPHLPPKLPIHALPEANLVAKLREFNGMPDEVLKDPELMRLALPIIRADLRLLETHVVDAGTPIPVPISVFGGLKDSTAPVGDLLAWSAWTSKAFRSRFIEGGHFFLFPSVAKVAGFVAKDLAASAGASEIPIDRSSAG